MFTHTTSTARPVRAAVRTRRVLTGIVVTALTGTALIATAATPAVAADGATCVLAADPAFVDCTQTFTYTGAEQTWTIPDGVTEVDVTAVGAPGGNRVSNTNHAGRGGIATVEELSITGLTELYIAVGGKGPTAFAANPLLDAFNGGTSATYGGPMGAGGGGGGASDVRTVSRTESGTLQSRVVVGGGGGGGGGASGVSTQGGDGGDPNSGGTPATRDEITAGGGGGGTLTEGGVGGTCLSEDCAGGDGAFPAVAPGNPGTFGQGGKAPVLFGFGGGGGGGGYYGGGGGALQADAFGVSSGGGGGGGSNYAPGGTTGVAADVNVPPSVTITWREAATLIVSAPAQVGSGVSFPVSASVSSVSLPAMDVTGSTTFTVTGGAGSCTGAECVVAVPGPTTVEGSYLERVASAPVTAVAAPGIPVVSSLTGGDTQVVVTFVPGVPGYPTETTYTVTATPTTPGQAPPVTTAPAGGSPITVTDLVNGVSYVFQVTATNTTGSTPSAVSTALTVGVPSTITGSAPAGIVGTPYTPYTYQVAGAPNPVTTVTAGSLPPGLTLTSAGVLSGTPTTAGSYTFTVTATNGVGSAQVQNTVLVTPANTPNKANLVLKVTAPASGTKGQAYTYTVKVNNQGPAAAKKVITSLVLPEDTQFVSATGNPTRIGRTVIWSADTIANGTTQTYTVTVKPTTKGTKTSLGITGSLLTPDPTPGSNIALTKITIN